MGGKASLSGGIGIIFFALAAFNLLRGESWVVWAILGVLFGGLSAFSGLGGGRKQP